MIEPTPATISPAEQDRLALPEHAEERAIRWRAYCEALDAYRRQREAATHQEAHHADLPLPPADR